MRFEQLVTTDELVGMQVPFAPRDSMPPLGQSYNEQGALVANFDHPAHTENALLALGLPGSAMRKGRIHWVDVNDHNFFNRQGIVWPIIEGDAARFKYVGAALTKYLPDKCMVFDVENPARPVSIQPLPLDSRILMWGRKDVQIDSYNDPCNFLVATAVDNFFGDLSDHYKPAMEACAESQARKAARHILHGLLGIAVARTGFERFYNRANKLDLLPRRRKQYDSRQFLLDTVLPAVAKDPDSRVCTTTFNLIFAASRRALGGPDDLSQVA